MLLEAEVIKQPWSLEVLMMKVDEKWGFSSKARVTTNENVDHKRTFELQMQISFYFWQVYLKHWDAPNLNLDISMPGESQLPAHVESLSMPIENHIHHHHERRRPSSRSIFKSQ